MKQGVSVIIPVFDRQKHGEAAIRSALAQDYAPFEVVVVDDGSTPPFLLPPEFEEDPRVRLIRLDRNCGPSRARNRGVEEAAGPWIAFLDSDDLWRPEKLSEQMHLAQELDKEQEHAPFFVSCFYLGSSVVTGKKKCCCPVPSNTPADFFGACWFSPGSTALLKKSDFVEIGGFDERMRRLEDNDFFIRFALKGGSLHVVESILADIHPLAKPPLAILDRSIKILNEKYGGAVPGHAPVEAPLVRRMRAYLDLEKASSCAFQGRRLKAALLLIRSFYWVPRLRLHLGRYWDPRPDPGGSLRDKAGGS